MSEKKEIRDPADAPTLFDRAKDYLSTRQQAYISVFSGDKNIYAKTVLDDLARFCRANESSFHPDPRVHAQLEGRREVWLRIQQHLTLSTDELAKLTLKEK